MYCLFATSAGEKSLVPFGMLGFDAIYLSMSFFSYEL
jgi:hypothetical protein